MASPSTKYINTLFFLRAYLLRSIMLVSYLSHVCLMLISCLRAVQAVCLARCNHANVVAAPRAQPNGLEAFRQHVIESCKSADSFLIASYSRQGKRDTSCSTCTAHHTHLQLCSKRATDISRRYCVTQLPLLHIYLLSSHPPLSVSISVSPSNHLNLFIHICTCTPYTPYTDNTDNRE